MAKLRSILELDEAGVEAPGGRRVLDGVSAGIEAGITVLMGRSGAGKSTLLRNLAGRIPRSWKRSGHVWCDGRRVLAGERAADAVLVPQEAQSGLDPRMPIGRLLRWAGGERSRDTVDELLAQLGLDAAALRPMRATALSGGMRHRVLLACGLLRAERLLLLDEPTAALDTENGERLMDAVASWANQDAAHRAVVLVSHDLPLMLPRADDCWVMAGGRLVERSPDPAALSSPEFRALERALETVAWQG